MDAKWVQNQIYINLVRGKPTSRKRSQNTTDRIAQYPCGKIRALKYVAI